MTSSAMETRYHSPELSLETVSADICGIADLGLRKCSNSSSSSGWLMIGDSMRARQPFVMVLTSSHFLPRQEQTVHFIPFGFLLSYVDKESLRS